MKRKTELERAELEEKVLRLRASNLSLRKIAEKLNLSHQTVRQILKRAMKAKSDENVTEFRAIALSRFDLLVSAALPAALKGDSRSIDSVAKITAEQAKLMNAYDLSHYEAKAAQEKYKAPQIQIVVSPRCAQELEKREAAKDERQPNEPPLLQNGKPPKENEEENEN